MEKIDGNRSLKNHNPGSGLTFGKQIKKDTFPRELNYFKTALKQFLKENDLDQKGMSRLNKIIELAHGLPKDELVIKTAVQEVLDDYLKNSTPVARTVEKEETSKTEGRKVSGSQSQDRHHQKYKHSDANGSASEDEKVILDEEETEELAEETEALQEEETEGLVEVLTEPYIIENTESLILK